MFSLSSVGSVTPLLLRVLAFTNLTVNKNAFLFFPPLIVSFLFHPVLVLYNTLFPISFVWALLSLCIPSAVPPTRLTPTLSLAYFHTQTRLLAVITFTQLLPLSTESMRPSLLGGRPSLLRECGFCFRFSTLSTSSPHLTHSIHFIYAHHPHTTLPCHSSCSTSSFRSTLP